MSIIRRFVARTGGMGIIAEMTFREALRERMIMGLLMVGGAFILGVQGLRDFNFGTSETRFILDFGLAGQGLFGALLVIMVTLHLFLGELDRGNAQTLLAKPLGRGSYLVGKWLGISALAGVFCVFTTGLLAGVLAATGDPQVAWVNLGFAGVAQLFRLMILAAMILLLSVISRTAVLAGLLALPVLAICHLHPLLVMHAAGSQEPFERFFASVVGVVLPDFQLFDLSEKAGSGEPIGWLPLGALGGYGLAYSGVMMGLAIHVFRSREI